jgi:pimeloyl-ACP methyl ester carboxylesterase
VTTIYRSAAGQQAVEQRYRHYLERWQVPTESRQIATRQGETFVIACGSDDAAPVVLLHGAGTNSTIWLADAAQWSQTRRVYLVDIIGEPGLSAPSRPSLQSDAYAEWLDDVLDGLGVERAAFVGASLGGWLALDYAIRRPRRVERLALRAPGGIGRQRYGVVVAAVFLTLLGERGRRITMQLALGPTPDLGDFIDYMLLVQKHYRPRRDQLPTFRDDQLRSLTTPLYVIVGAHDRMLDSHDTVRRFDQLVPHAKVAVVPDAGHALTDDGDVIDRFLTDGLGR